MMDHRTRFFNTLRFKSVDRLPMIEWATWWDKTIDRWKQEGLPTRLNDDVEIMEYFGLDLHKQWWFPPEKHSFPEALSECGGGICSMDDYLRIREHLFPKPPIKGNSQIIPIQKPHLFFEALGHDHHLSPSFFDEAYHGRSCFFSMETPEEALIKIKIDPNEIRLVKIWSSKTKELKPHTLKIVENWFEDAKKHLLDSQPET